MSPSYRMGRMGGKGEAGRHGQRAGLALGARKRHEAYKEASERSEA